MKQMSAKLVLLLRKAAQRTTEATWLRIGSLLDAFSPKLRRNAEPVSSHFGYELMMVDALGLEPRTR